MFPIIHILFATISTNPVFIGTSGLGHVSPAASVPFGLVQAGPDTSISNHEYQVDWAHTCGYQHDDRWLWRFSQTHIMGTGCASFGDFGILPTIGDFDALTHPALLLKDTEKAEPGFYSIDFVENDVRLSAAMTVREHTVLYRFIYPEKAHAKLLIDLDWGLGGVRDSCWGKLVKHTHFTYANDGYQVSGSREVSNWTDYHLHFSATFSHPFQGKPSCRRMAGDGHGEIWELDFGELPDGVLFVTIGLSYTSTDAAAQNRVAEIPTFDFEWILGSAKADWAKALASIELGDATDPNLALNFRAALYRTFLQPNLISDVGDPQRYSTLSLWDTFRAAHPLYTFTAPDRVPDFVNSMLDLYDRQGYLPIWGLAGLDTHCMVGHHAVPVIVDAYLKELMGSAENGNKVDPERAYRAIKDSLTQEHTPSNVGGWGLLKEDWRLLDQFGYYPYDQLGHSDYAQKPLKGESVARLLECAYDDACAARFARELKHTKDADRFARRANCWTNVYDAETGFMRGKDSAGKWREPFNPYAIGHGAWEDNDYCEGNAWQYTWHVLHDFDGLVSAMGGREKARVRLDGLFSARPPDFTKDGDDNNVTGVIGQYVHGNEPSHHIAYFYTLLGAPEKTAEIIRQIFATQYFPRPDGLCGNDDCGQMAAWYVFSALGFYPVDPCGGDYVIGTPQVPSATMRLANGKRLTIRVEGELANGWVEATSLNGRRLMGSVIRHQDLSAGGELVFHLASPKAPDRRLSVRDLQASDRQHPDRK